MFRGADFAPLLLVAALIIVAIAAVAFGLGAWIF
jgi:hypothetical protein